MCILCSSRNTPVTPGSRSFFVEDLDALVAQLAERGLDPVQWETYTGGVRKLTYRDPDGNEIGLGGAPL